MSAANKISTGDPSSWKTICITKGEMAIGRASAKHAERAAKTSNMFFENRHVSKTHAKFSITNGVLYLQDLSSTFGTVWNNYLLIPFKRVEIREGDRIGFVLNKPSKSIQDIIKKARGSDMISMDILLNPLVQMVYSVVSVDAAEGSIVLLPLSGVDSLSDSRKESQARSCFVSSDTETWGGASQNKSAELSKPLRSSSPFEVSTPGEESDDPPIEESYERRFCVPVQHDSDSSQKQMEEDILVESTAQAVAISCPDSAFPVDLIEVKSCEISEDNNLKQKPEPESVSVLYSSDIDDRSKIIKDVISSDDSDDSEISDECDDADSSQEEVDLGEGSEAESSDCHKSSDTSATQYAFPEFSDEVKKNEPIPPYPSESTTRAEGNPNTSEELQAEEEPPKDTQEEDSVLPRNIIGGLSIADTVLGKTSPHGKEYCNDDCSIESLSDDADDVELSSDEECVPQFGGKVNHIFDVEEDDDVAFDTLDYTSEEDAHSSGEESEENLELILNSEEHSIVSPQKTNIFDLIASANGTDTLESLSMDDNKCDNEEKYATNSESKILPNFNAYAIRDTVCGQRNRKRAHDTIEISDEPDVQPTNDVEVPAPKKAKSKSIAREIGKGLFYVTGTLVALVAYGGYLEKSGIQ